MKSLALIDGNLALAPAPHPSAFQVVDGHLAASVHASSPTPRRIAPDRVHIAFVMALVVASLVGMIAVFQSQQARFDAALGYSDRQEIVVESGDTLWSIAESYQIEGADTQQTVDVIRSWNSLSESVLQPGDVIVVPA